jgi:Arc/MetJ-type ribon-helix-helix transcriptional regulator
METELAKFLDSVFAPYGDFPARNEVIRELLANLTEKYNDYIEQGMSKEEAYQATTASFGDVTEIMDQLAYDKAKQPANEKHESSIRSTIILSRLI